MTCTFFGHRYMSDDIEEKARGVIIDLIENHGVDNFYVGVNGGFDSMIGRILDSLSKQYDIKYARVYQTLATRENRADIYDYRNCIFPDGYEKTPPKFAIDHRNRWMLNKADYVVTYICNLYESGAAKYAEIAEKRGKKIIKLGIY